MQSFNIGDRVIGVGVMTNVDITGLTGTIVKNESDIYDYAVSFDEPQFEIQTIYGDLTSFHDCYGKAEEGCGYFCNEENLEPYEPSPMWAEGMCLSELLE